MKSISYLLLLVFGAAVFSSCTGPRYASMAEYDDAYFTQADIAAPVAVQSSSEDRYQEEATQSSPRTYRQPVDNYQDAYYGDDDFTFSRRIRRFNNRNSAYSWRYYDPFYANDLYYVMGTPAWNRWNNNGWYNWNSPRFGAFGGWNDPFFNPYSSPYAGWGAFNPRFNRNPFAFDPWASSYYGYGVGVGFGSPFYNPGFGGFGGGFGSAYYCPPVGFVSSTSGWRRVNNAQQAYVTRRRTSTQPSRATAGTTSRQNIDRTRTATNTNRQSRSNNYMEPRRRPTTTTGRTAAPTRTTGRRDAARNTNTYTRPGRSTTNRNGTVNTNRNTNRNSSRYNNNGRTNSSRNNRTYTRPNNSSRNNSSINRNSNTNRNNSFNRSTNSSSRNNNSSFNRSSSSSSSSFNRSSGRSSSSNNNRSSSRSGGRRR